jgi:hypothetical protein
MYEDPGQQDEKKQLTSLFETQMQSGMMVMLGGGKEGGKGLQL